MILTNKRYIALFLALTCILTFSGCDGSHGGNANDSFANDSIEMSGNDTPEEAYSKDEVRIGLLKGPTGMGMAGVMRQAEEGNTVGSYEFIMAPAPEDMRALVINGSVDIAALPTNMASALYSIDDGSVKVIAVNTLGVLYVLDRQSSIASVEDLQGKILYATGQGATSEFVLNYILEQNGLVVGKDVVVEYKSVHDELATLMVAEEADLGMLPEPFVTTTISQSSDIEIVLDIAQEWDRVTDGAALTMGCLVVRTEFLESHPDLVKAFLDEYRQSVEFVNNNHTEAATLMEQYDIIAAQVAEKAIPNCNIVFMDGGDMQISVQSYLQVLFEANPQSVGGSLPDDAFYYLG